MRVKTLLPCLWCCIAIALGPSAHARDSVSGTDSRKNTSAGPESILGGTQAANGEFPFMVQVRPNDDLCAGSLISDRWIITAAHCMEDIFAASDISVRAGSNLLSSGGEVVSALRFIVHPDFDALTFDHDIALIELASPVTANNTEATNWLGGNESALLPEGASVVVAGWGSTSFGGSTSEDLLKVSVTVQYPNTCRDSSLYTENEITDKMLCAGVPEGGQDACQGDSGGPLIVYDNGQAWLAGIVSWGQGCGLADYPGVYTRVAKFDRWVREQTGLGVDPPLPVSVLPKPMLLIMTLALGLFAMRRATAA
jgi:trypsin